ncbi:MAG: hypothetical protein ACI97K_001913 [Glaciecola sp.]|jgi:hypothetical protein
MSKKSLPLTLYRTLEKHVQNSDINDDKELQDILVKLAALSQKVETFKQRAIEIRIEKALNVIDLKSRR